MQYIVTADRKTCGKRPGELITESDIITAGGNVEKLLAEGSIKKKDESPKVKIETKEESQVVNTPVYKTNNTEGDK